MAPNYHLIYEDWETDFREQAVALDGVIQDFWRETRTILDAACGIGTQSIGLAQLGYTIAGSDIAEQALERARLEAVKRGLKIDFRLGDMRRLSETWKWNFDLVIACDNAVPHLLSDEELLAAFRQFNICTRAGGGCIISVRDYAHMSLGGQQLVPRTIHNESGSRIIVFDVWEFEGDIYEMSTYIVRDDGQKSGRFQVLRGKYYCVTTEKLEALMVAAGYMNVQTLYDRYFQPLVIGTKQSI